MTGVSSELSTGGMVVSDASENSERFSLVLGGPFHRALRRLGLTGPDQLPTQWAAFGLALTAWLIPALLVVIQTIVDHGYSGWGFFSDWTGYTRFQIAVWIMVATESYADSRLLALVQHFHRAGIISDVDRPAFQSALERADRLSSSAFAEFFILVIALVWSSLVADYTVSLSSTGWEGSIIAGESVLSWAGEAVRFISAPLFLFLVLRWIWRFLVWTLLLYRFSRLSLQLMPFHADRSGGLGFLANFPGIFSGFILALSCVVSASMIKDLGFVEHAATTVWFAMAGWLVISVGLVLSPLLVFARPLYALRERALIDYGRLASEHHLAFHQKWIAERRDGKEMLGDADVSSAADLNAIVDMVRSIRFIPVDFTAVLQIVGAAALPLIAVAITLIPIGELFKWIVGAVF